MSNSKSLVFVRTSYTTDLGKAEAHVKYIAFRSREKVEDTRGAFDAEKDYADVGGFIDRLDDPATKHHRNPKIHKMIISFREEDYQKYGLDLQRITRDVMRMLEKKKGIKLDWVAAVHMAEGHPHVHVAIKSVGRTDDGRTKRFRFDKATDFSAIRSEAMREIQNYRTIERMLRIAHIEKMKTYKLVRNFGQSMVFSIKRHMNQEQYKAEMKKRRDLEQAEHQRDQERKGRGR